MISKIFFLDFIKNKKNLILKFIIPFIIVFTAFQFGYGRITLVMLLIFTVITGAGLKIVKLKTSGVYNRLIISPIKKSNLFFEITIVTSFFYFIQFIPALIVTIFYENIMVIIYSFIAILLVVLCGILIGIHAKSLGEIHLYSIIFLIPLIGFTMTNSSFSHIFPFASIFHSNYTFLTLFYPVIFFGGLFLLLLLDVKRL